MSENVQDTSWYCSWWTIILAVNAVLGCVALEWAWKSLHRFRNPN